MDVAASSAKRNSYTVEKTLALWTFYTLNALYWTNNENRVVVGYDNFLEHHGSYIDLFKKNFQLEFDRKQLDEKLKDFLKPSLRHSKTSATDFINNKEYSVMVRELFEITINSSKLQVDHSINEEIIDKFYQEFILQGNMWAHAVRRRCCKCFTWGKTIRTFLRNVPY